MANIQNILSEDLQVIPQGAGTVLLRLKAGVVGSGVKGDTGISGAAGRAGTPGASGAKGDTGASGTGGADETLFWLAL